MAISPLALKAYANVQQIGQESKTPKIGQTASQEGGQSFTETLGKSLENVNALSEEKSRMIEEFATGKTQNVHELMITLQKAGMAMSMTAAVRNKVMEAYKELMRMTF